MGRYLADALRALESPLIVSVRGRGLLLGVEIDPQHAPAREVCERLMEHGILTKETHETVVRLAPPLIIDKPTIDLAVERFDATLKTFTVK